MPASLSSDQKVSELLSRICGVTLLLLSNMAANAAARGQADALCLRSLPHFKMSPTKKQNRSAVVGLSVILTRIQTDLRAQEIRMKLKREDEHGKGGTQMQPDIYGSMMNEMAYSETTHPPTHGPMSNHSCR